VEGSETPLSGYSLTRQTFELGTAHKIANVPPLTVVDYAVSRSVFIYGRAVLFS
jgi:Ran GTPase-activating protein (RanGAP) involved in mRNA processing and transport